ncbi:type I-C CRISPR-associated protein Cas8c/Csd1 [Allokutzneria sp. A3M-2-11 16]|uniref:type I-C CRISPR-associated protein Cas8c/Csd1 n=1 Tax=Allokutzneria sp. A3M-2-11 16 TaxID=2962043 RepID=UPI0020B64147|nr:type I-C CRISPR-associated protein Cas8c/Csd1 [Allokutzneria sp. A3M-2-11 16]MCP3798451.1 type I-C CRISPR-associated protein Cas8c/Csd1 [Allokutzneria sp. A3M-2-11 16]
MYLKRLRDFAESSGEMPPPFHTWSPVRWLLDLDPQGNPIGELVDLAVPDEPSRRNGKRELVPKLQRSGTAPQPLLACDNLQNALGWTDSSPRTQADADKQAARAERCYQAFTALVAAWIEQHSHDHAAQALHAFLGNGGPQRLPRPEKYRASDLVMFRVNETFVHLSPTARDFWTNVARERKSSSGRCGVCLVCGQRGDLVDTFPRQVTAGLIPALGYDPDSRSKNRPQPSAVTLASMNKPALGYELTTQLEHAPICGTCAEWTVAALDHLLRSRDHRRTIGDTAVTWWLLGTPEGTVAPIQLVFDPDEAAIDELLAELPRDTGQQVAPDPQQLVKTVGSMLDSPKQGRESGEIDTGTFCAAAVTSNKTRLILRDWIDVSLPAAKQAVTCWFSDHAVLDPWTGRIQRFSLYRLLLALGRWDRRTNTYLPLGDPRAHRPISAQRDLFTAALRTTPLPPSIAFHLVQRLRADRHLDGPRLALLRLLTTRTFNTTGRTTPLALDDSDDDLGYLSGRLFAVLESLQYAATKVDNKKLNTTLTDRYLPAASTSPARVMPDLLRGSQAHLKKLANRKRDSTATAYAKLRDELCGRLKPFPLTLDLAQQCSWFNGYADQRNHHFAKIAAHKKSAEPGLGAPEADPIPTDIS